MFLPFIKSRPALTLILTAVALTTGWLHAAPYGPDGMNIEWTQPDDSKLSLRVFGDEFYGRTETLDGYTVVFDPATKSYYYADISADGQELVATGMVAGKGNPQALGLAKNLEIQPAARKAKAAARFQQWDEATGNSQRWAELKDQRQAYDEAVQAAKDEDGPMPAPPSFTTIGDKVGLTLLIDFSDAVATIPQANVIDYCNGDNYTGYSNNGSVKKYYQDNSNNLLTYTNTVTAYIRMAQPKSYYNDTTQDSGLRGRLLISDAIDIMKALPNYETEILPTFDTLSVDGSNRAVACNVFFAGGNSGVWAKGLWPHSWSLASAKELSAGGKKVYKYQITNLGTSLTLGTFCHENGHMLCGYPDIYDYDYDSAGGAGKFCLMNSGGNGTNPVLINGYLKRASGWTTTTDLSGSSNLTGTLTATVGHADYNKIYRYANPGNAKEYFLFENRQKTGRDANIPASGIAIWHVDEQGNHNNQSLTPNTTHANYEVSLIQADNLWQFQSNTNSGDSKDLYYLGNTAAAYTNTFNDASSPDAKWWSGASSGLNVFNFSASGATMTLQFGLPANTIIVSAPNGGEQVYFNSTRNITWLSNTSGNVKIELFKAGTLHTVLSASETNDGSYSWLVSPGLPAGSDYTIKISSVATPAYTDSSNAAFSILTQPTLADALDTTGLTWTNSGNANWFAQSSTNYDGSDAAQSGAIGDSQNSYMETTLTGPGTLTFWWKVSSETNYDYLRFYLNGTEQTGSLAKISGTVNWVQKTVAIPSGNQTVKWGYTKDGSLVSGSDAAWVDQVVYTPSVTPEIAVEQPVGTSLTDGGASVDCGIANLTSSASPVTFTVKNLGDGNLTGLSLTTDGSHSADFTLGSLGATTLAPGISTTFSVTFSPSAAGARNATIHLASNDADENPFDLALTGTGVTVGTLAVTPAGNQATSGSLGGPFSPNPLQYTLSNPGTTSINWTAAKTAAWVDLSAASGTLAPDASTTVTVTINSNADSLPISNHSETLTFTNTTNNNGDTTRGVSLTVNPIPATVTLGNLSQTYSGSPKSVSVTTDPPGLAHTVTYNGSPAEPTDAGTYAVVATITEPNYAGSNSEDLVIEKAPQSITFAALPDGTDIDAPFALGATATSGLPVSYTSSSTAVASVDGNIVTIVGLGTTTITASQAGNANYATATAVPQPLTVVRANPLAIITGAPYKVLIGQTLSLIGSASHPSHGNTITSYGWDLNGDDDYSDATGATPSAISVATLISTWGMTEGQNTIQLKVTDSANKNSIVTATVEIILSLTWDANGTGANRTDGAGAWLTANQWWDGAANATWAPNSAATFGNAGTGGAVTLASPTTVNTLTFNTFSGTYTLGTAGQAITLNNGITKNSGSAIVTFISPITLGAAQTWTNHSGGTLTSSGVLNNNGNQLVVDGTGTTNFGVINSVTVALTGSGALVKNGSGRLNIGGVNSGFSGTVTINGGVLQMTNDPGGLGNGNLMLNGGVLSAYWGITYTRTLGTGNGAVQIPGGESGFAGAGTNGPTYNLGATVVWGASGVGSATGYFNPGKFVLGDSGTTNAGVTTFSSAINLNGATRTILVPYGLSSGGNNSTISGVISGTAGLTKEGTGLLNLTQTNSYNGVTTISAGILDATTFAAGGSNSSIGITAVSAANLVLNGGTLRHSAANVATTNRLFSVGTSGGGIDSSAALATNTLSFTATAAFGFIGTGTRTLTLGGSNTGNNTMALLIGNDGANATSLAKTGTGTWILTNSSNSYTGATTIAGGSLQSFIPGGIGTTGGTSALIFNGGVLGLTTGDFTRSLGSNTTVTAVNFTGAGGWAAYGANRNVNLGGALAQIVWATADTGFNAKTLILGAATATHKVTLQNGLDLGTAVRTVQTDDGTGAVDGELSGIITGGAGGGLTKSGAGVLSLSNANTYIGVTTVNAGVLRLDHATALPGGIADTGGSSALVFTGGVLGLGNGNFTRPLGTNTTATAVNFTNAGGWAAYGADRIVNLGNAATTITWATANTGFNNQTLILGAASATHMVDLQNPLGLTNAARTVQVNGGSAAIDARLSGNITSTTTAGGLTKTGAGTLALIGTNSYTGTTVNGFNNPAAGTSLIFQGMQALSSTTTLQQTHAGGTGGFGTIRILDDAATPTAKTNVNIAMLANNTSHTMTLFVGNNNTANDGNSSGTTTGSAITLGNLNFTQNNVGNTSQTLSVTGANGYGLQINNVNLPGLLVSATTWNGILTPTSARLTVAGNVQQVAGNAAGTLTFTLDGTASGNQIMGNILNSVDSKPLTLVKSNTSTWRLSGTNSYTGATTVSSGKLFVNGDQTAANGAVSVSTNATLGGTGIIGGSTTLAASGKLEFDLGTAPGSHDQLDLAAGKTLTFSGGSVLTITSSGGASPGTYTLISAPGGIIGSVPATVSLPVGWAATVSTSGFSLLLNVTSTGADTIPPTLASITDDKSGGPVAVNTLVTYTVTFSEDIDATTVTATDFGNAGTAAVTIGSVTETTPGVFTVQATPTSAGTLRLQIPISAVLRDVAGNALDNDPALADDTIITVNTAFDSWANGTFANGTLSDKNAALDFDGGGLATGIEWVVGGDPTTGNDDVAKAPTIDTTMDPAYLTYTYRRRDAANTDAKTAINVEYGSDLSGWTTAVAGPDIIITASNNFYGTSPGIDRVEVKIKRSSFDTKLFTRLKVAITP